MLLFFFEFQRRRVDAIAQVGGLRPVVEHMAEVGAALAANGFGAPHQKTIVLFALDILRGNRRPEARPAGAGIELGIGAKQLVTTADTTIHALFVVVPILAGERPL